MKIQLLVWGLLLTSVGFSTTNKVRTDFGTCDVQVIFTQDEPGNQCGIDEVMVGITSVSPMTIKCGQLSITCGEARDTATKKETSTQIISRR